MKAQLLLSICHLNNRIKCCNIEICLAQRINTKNGLRFWLFSTLIFTLVASLVSLVVQQNYRLTANDPQIQMSEDMAQKLSMNPITTTLTTPDQVFDVSASLSPFEIVYDDKGNVLTSSGILDGQTPVLPSGVLDYAQTHGQDRFTWQPKSGVRLATVVTYYSGKSSGYVLVARSLREIENRENQLTEQIALWWVASIVFGLIFSLLSNITAA